MILHDDRSLLALQGPEAVSVLQVGAVLVAVGRTERSWGPGILPPPAPLPS